MHNFVSYSLARVYWLLAIVHIIRKIKQSYGLFFEKIQNFHRHNVQIFNN